MIERLTIEGYRGFERFEMEGLGRINLLVGRNNSGKTSVLEALWLLATAEAAGGEWPAALWMVAHRRDEVVAGHARLKHLFYMAPERKATDYGLSVTYQEGGLSLTLSNVNGRQYIEHRRSPRGQLDFHSQLDIVDEDALARPTVVSLFEQEGWPVPPIVGPNVLERNALVNLFGRIVLSPDEERLIESMQLLDPRIQRLGITGGKHRRLMTKVEGFSQRLPLGHLGGGVTRFAQLWLSLLASERGPLLIDEIDSGLHHSVMVDMWRQVHRLAVERDVQIFATTHSWDCVAALGEMCALEAASEGDVSLQRIAAGRSKPVYYTPERILIAAEEGIEVR